jgi:predicted transcriptional regulator
MGIYNVKHVAIINPKWKLIDKILNGEKTIESRWYNRLKTPFGQIKKGDILYFKEKGKPISVKTQVVKTLEFKNLDPEDTRSLFDIFGEEIGIDHNNKDIVEYFDGRKHAILIWFNNVEKINPLTIKNNNSYNDWITFK